MRADARENRERLLEAARTVFAEQGTHASLNQIAHLAGVGPGTLYRHFPNLQSLLVAIIAGEVDALCARGRDLLGHPSPDQALGSWLRALAVHATAMRGLVANEMMAAAADPAVAACHEAIRGTGAALLARAQAAGVATEEIDIVDLLKVINAIAWANQQSPGDDLLLDRLLTLLTNGVRTRA